jgi:hypothetical protein
MRDFTGACDKTSSLVVLTLRSQGDADFVLAVRDDVSAGRMDIRRSYAFREHN